MSRSAVVEIFINYAKRGRTTTFVNLFVSLVLTGDPLITLADRRDAARGSLAQARNDPGAGGGPLEIYETTP